MSIIKVGAIQNTSGVEVYTAKCWVNFNGTGTVAIRASGNVTSITDGGVGTYTVNFTTAMADTNFAANVSSGSPQTIATSTRTTTSLLVLTRDGGSVVQDQAFVDVSIFR